MRAQTSGENSHDDFSLILQGVYCNEAIIGKLDKQFVAIQQGRTE
jgi:hypothetical protein